MTKFPRRQLVDGEQILDEFHPHWRVLLGPAAATTAAGLLVIVPGVLRLDDIASLVAQVLFGALCMLAAAALGIAALKRATTQFVLTDRRLLWHHGILHRRGVEIPLEQINTVKLSRNPLERLLGYGDLTIESASTDGTSEFHDIPNPQAFQSRLNVARDSRKRQLRGTDQQPTATTAAVHHDRWSQLERLAQLRRDGLLSDDEFETAKRDLLS